MSDLMRVTVLTRDQAQVEFEVRLIHPDANRFCVSKQFVMMLIRPERYGDQYKLDFDVPIDPLVGADLAESWAAWEEAGHPYYDIVVGVSVGDLKHYPRQEDAPAPSAVYRVGLRDAADCAHLVPGTSWGSAAYDEARTGLFYPPLPKAESAQAPSSDSRSVPTNPDTLAMSWEVLEPSLRTTHLLRRHGFETIGDLADGPRLEAALAKWPSQLDEVRSILSAMAADE